VGTAHTMSIVFLHRKKLHANTEVVVVYQVPQSKDTVPAHCITKSDIDSRGEGEGEACSNCPSGTLPSTSLAGRMGLPVNRLLRSLYTRCTSSHTSSSLLPSSLLSSLSRARSWPAGRGSMAGLVMQVVTAA
jgi:hypothetical protein